jgi:hypothetical protein
MFLARMREVQVPSPQQQSVLEKQDRVEQAKGPAGSAAAPSRMERHSYPGMRCIERIGIAENSTGRREGKKDDWCR